MRRLLHARGCMTRHRIRNNFYLTPYSSKLSIVSNENPSATKAFEAVSLETSYPGWRMDVATQEQEGETREFSEKENDQYAAVPKDAKVSAANLTYVGTASGDQLTSESLEEGRIVLSTMSGRFAPGILCYRNKAQGTEFDAARCTGWSHCSSAHKRLKTRGHWT